MSLSRKEKPKILSSQFKACKSSGSPNASLPQSQSQKNLNSIDLGDNPFSHFSINRFPRSRKSIDDEGTGKLLRQLHEKFSPQDRELSLSFVSINESQKSGLEEYPNSSKQPDSHFHIHQNPHLNSERSSQILEYDYGSKTTYLNIIPVIPQQHIQNQPHPIQQINVFEQEEKQETQFCHPFSNFQFKTETEIAQSTNPQTDQILHQLPTTSSTSTQIPTKQIMPNNSILTPQNSCLFPIKQNEHNQFTEQLSCIQPNNRQDNYLNGESIMESQPNSSFLSKWNAFGNDFVPTLNLLQFEEVGQSTAIQDTAPTTIDSSQTSSPKIGVNLFEPDTISAQIPKINHLNLDTIELLKIDEQAQIESNEYQNFKKDPLSIKNKNRSTNKVIASIERTKSPNRTQHTSQMNKKHNLPQTKQQIRQLSSQSVKDLKNQTVLKNIEQKVSSNTKRQNELEGNLNDDSISFISPTSVQRRNLQSPKQKSRNSRTSTTKEQQNSSIRIKSPTQETTNQFSEFFKKTSQLQQQYGSIWNSSRNNIIYFQSNQPEQIKESILSKRPSVVMQESTNNPQKLLEQQTNKLQNCLSSEYSNKNEISSDKSKFNQQGKTNSKQTRVSGTPCSNYFSKSNKITNNNRENIAPIQESNPNSSKLIIKTKEPYQREGSLSIQQQSLPTEQGTQLTKVNSSQFHSRMKTESNSKTSNLKQILRDSSIKQVSLLQSASLHTIKPILSQQIQQKQQHQYLHQQSSRFL